MAEHLTLSISGYDGKPVPNQFLKQEGDANGLAILLPGLGYTNAMPLLYYSELQFLAGGYDVLLVDYDYRGSGFEPWTNPGDGRRLFEDVSAAVRIGTAERNYAKVTLVGKSLGTLAMAQLADTGALPESWVTVWLTPLLRQPLVMQSILDRTGPASVVIGTDDYHFDSDLVDALGKRDGISVITVEDAGHSLNAGDTVGDAARGLANIFDQLDTFHNFPRQDAGEVD